MHKEKYIRSLKQNTWNKLAAKKSCWILGLQTVHQSVYSLRFPRRPLPPCLLQFYWNFLPEQVAVKKKIPPLPPVWWVESSATAPIFFFTLNSWGTKSGARSKTQITALPARQGGSLSLWNRCQEKQCFLSALPGRRCQGASEGAGFPPEWVCWWRETWGALVSQNQGLSASILPCFA